MSALRDNDGLVMVLYQPGFAYDRQITNDRAAGEMIVAKEGSIDPADLTDMEPSSTSVDGPRRYMSRIFTNATGQLNRTDRLNSINRD